MASHIRPKIVFSLNLLLDVQLLIQKSNYILTRNSAAKQFFIGNFEIPADVFYIYLVQILVTPEQSHSVAIR